MYNGKKIGVIIAAAGKGTRMGLDIPKQFMRIGEKPVIVKAYEAFADCQLVDNIYVVTNEEYMKYCKDLMVPYLNENQLKKFTGIVSGGKERQDSIYRALKAIEKQEIPMDYVLIHDGARPFVTKKIIEDTIYQTVLHDAAVVCVKPKDTIRTEVKTLDRNRLLAVQTPQGFKRDILKRAYDRAYEDNFYGTDDASIVERMDIHPAIVEGSYGNIKITTKEDLPVETRIGQGFDVHKLVEGRKCILGGVDIPHETGLLGHSDADVLLHAIMDALLGAAGMGDIGRHFPDTDEAYRGASSLDLLEHVGYLIREKGYSIGNIDATVICQKPKILPYVEEMIENISKTLKIDYDQINIKGTTTEKLGFTGRKEGIAAQAVCILKTN